MVYVNYECCHEKSDFEEKIKMTKYTKKIKKKEEAPAS